MITAAATDSASRALRGLGIELGGELTHGSQITLSRGNSQQVYQVSVVAQSGSDGAEATALSLVHDAFRAPSPLRQLLILGYANTRLVTTLENAGVDYVDAAGNVGVEFGDVLIRIRGKRASSLQAAYGERARLAYPKSRSTNLFSPTRSKVVFALLVWPYLMNGTIREVAQAAGTSQGSAHLTTDLLRDLGHTDKTPSGTRWRDWSRTADAWLATYPTALGRSLLLTKLSGNIDKPRKVSVEDPIFLSGESAFSSDQRTRLAYVDRLIRPTTLTLYVGSYDPQLAIENRWRSDGHPNIFIREKFWKSPDHGDGPLAGFRSAPPLLVIADLRSTNEPRQMEAAQQLLDIEHDRHS